MYDHLEKPYLYEEIKFTLINFVRTSNVIKVEGLTFRGTCIWSCRTRRLFSTRFLLRWWREEGEENITLPFYVIIYKKFSSCEYQRHVNVHTKLMETYRNCIFIYTRIFSSSIERLLQHLIGLLLIRVRVRLTVLENRDFQVNNGNIIISGCPSTALWKTRQNSTISKDQSLCSPLSWEFFHFLNFFF